MLQGNYTTKSGVCQGVIEKIVEVSPSEKYAVDAETGECLPILIDKNKRGRDRPWRICRLNTLEVAKACRMLAGRPSLAGAGHWERRAERLEDCATFLQFGVWRGQGEGGEDLKKVIKAGFCTQRICPMCGWRRSLKIQSSVRRILQATEQGGEYAYLMLTLTIPNVAGNVLSGAVDEMFKAWKRLSELKRFQDSIVGWYRGLEITHNVDKKSKSYDTYHPHFHCLLMVKQSYFKRGYITQAEWLKMWQRSMRNNNITQVDVRRVKPKNGKTDIIGAVCEVAKYTVKPAGYIIKDDPALTCSAVEVIDEVLHGRRLVAFGGEMKRLHEQLNLGDEVDGDLIDVGEHTATGDPDEVLSYFWHVGYSQYILCAGGGSDE